MGHALMKFLLPLLALLLLPTLAWAQNFGNIKPRTLLGNPDASTSRPAAPVPMDNVGGVTISPMSYGAVGDGVANDTAAVQAAINAAQSVSGATPRRIVDLGPHCYGINATLTITGAVTIQGTGKGDRHFPDTCPSGFRALVANLNQIEIQGLGTILRDFTMVTKASVLPNTSGIAIHNVTADTVVSGVSIFKPCIGISESGNTNAYYDNTIGLVKGAGCVAITVGRQSTNANTVDPRFVSNLLFGDDTLAGLGGDAGMEIQDCGGCFVETNDILYFQVGTLIAPKTANQALTWGFFNNTALGDTDNLHDLVIRPVLASNYIFGLQFTGSWTANAQTGSPILIDNTAGANIAGVRFLGHRAFSSGTVAGPNPLNVFELNPGSVAAMDGIAIESSELCSQYNSTGVGLKVLTNLFTDLTIRGNRFGNCDHGASVGTMATGIQLPTGVVGGQLMMITDNNFTGVTTPLLWTGAGEGAVVNNNLGLHGIASITAAATITLPNNDIVAITGATPVQTMNGFWGVRNVSLINVSGLNFTAGGNICAGFPTGIVTNTLLTATWAGCWYIH